MSDSPAWTAAVEQAATKEVRVQLMEALLQADERFTPGNSMLGAGDGEVWALTMVDALIATGLVRFVRVEVERD
jgi:hypothetical protein